MSQCECYATAIDPERKAMWERVFPGGKCPVTTPMPLGEGKLRGEIAYYFLIDFERISPESKEKLIEEISQKFNDNPADIIEQINVIGMPVKAEEILVTWCEHHTMNPDYHGWIKIE